MATEKDTIVPFRLERVLHLIKGDINYLANLKIGPPTLSKGVWACHWSLDILHPTGLAMTGDDSLDSLLRSVKFVANFIRGSEEDGWEIWWQARGDHGGLPVIGTN